MSSYIPGAGFKKPLNMLEQPIYPDIKKGPPIFKWSGRYNPVDVGQTMLDTEADTQLISDAILSQAYSFGKDRYGHSSHQEKLVEFRPPLENFYEDHGPLNRLPTKVNAIIPRINPGTTAEGSGTSLFINNNNSIQEIDKFITDRISTNTYRTSFYAPLDLPMDNSVLPDLVTSLPNYSVNAGFAPQIQIDAPREYFTSDIQKPQVSGSAGFKSNYNLALHNQTSTDVTLSPTGPSYSGSAGFNVPYTIDDKNNIENFQLERTNPFVTASAGYNTQYVVDGETRKDYNLQYSMPRTPVSAGYSAPYTSNIETRLDEIELTSQINAPMRVINPGSETGYQSRDDAFTTPQEHLKVRYNPQVVAVAGHAYDYREKNSDQNFHVRSKIMPVKSYDSGLNSGTIRTMDVPAPPIQLKYDSLRNRKLAK